MRKNYLLCSADENSLCDTSESSLTDVKEQMCLLPGLQQYLSAVVLERDLVLLKGTHVSIQITNNVKWIMAAAMHIASSWRTFDLVLVLPGTHSYGTCPHSALLPVVQAPSFLPWTRVGASYWISYFLPCSLQSFSSQQ